MSDKRLRAPAWTRIKKADLDRLSPRQQELYRLRLETDPPRTPTQAAEKMGVSPGTVANQWIKIKARIGYDPLKDLLVPGRKKRKSKEDEAVDQLSELAPQSTAKLMEEKIRIMVSHITKERAAQASVGELARGAESLTRARAQILGEPTQILTVEHRHHMQDLVPALLKEAQQRGYRLVDGKLIRPEPDVIEAEATHVE